LDQLNHNGFRDDGLLGSDDIKKILITLTM
jgi:hypothetical protein